MKSARGSDTLLEGMERVRRNAGQAEGCRWALVALGLLLCACDQAAQPLSHWTLRGLREVDLPGQLPVDDLDQVYVLDAEVRLASELVAQDLDFVIPRLLTLCLALDPEARPSARELAARLAS